MHLCPHLQSQVEAGRLDEFHKRIDIIKTACDFRNLEVPSTLVLELT
jgi:hypothetical protein